MEKRDKEIKPLTICLIGGAGFIGSHLCDKLMTQTSHKAIVIDVSSDKIDHLLDESCSWLDRIQFHNLDLDSCLETSIKDSDIVIDLATISTEAKPIDTIDSNFLDAIPVVKCCLNSRKRLIHFSSSQVYGKTIASFLPKNHPLQEDPNFYMLKENASPCISGPVTKQSWSYASSKQMLERYIYALYTQQGLEFTIVRPFNWIGPRMDYFTGIASPAEVVPKVLACLSTNLMYGEPLNLVDGGQSKRSFCYIKDAIDAVLLMIDNPDRANGKIFNVGNPNNEVTVQNLAEMLMKVYAKVTGDSSISDLTSTDLSSEKLCVVDYDDSDRRIPDMTKITTELGWNPVAPLDELLEVTLRSYLPGPDN